MNEQVEAYLRQVAGADQTDEATRSMGRNLAHVYRGIVEASATPDDAARAFMVYVMAIFTLARQQSC